MIVNVNYNNYNEKHFLYSYPKIKQKYCSKNYEQNEQNSKISEDKIICRLKTESNVKAYNNNFKNGISHQLNNKQPKKEVSQNGLNNYEYPLIILINVGNTTYITTVIRCFSDIFSKYYLDNINIITNNITKMPLSFFYTEILFNLFPKQGTHLNTWYSLDKFYNALIYLNPIFKGKSTKNVNDFLIYFINELSKENKVILNNNIQNGNTKIDEEFSWVSKKVEKCWACGKESITISKYLTYDLDFGNALNKAIFNNKNKLSLFNCIKYSLEKIYRYNIFCFNCNKKDNFERTSSIENSSNNLIFLNRIENTEIINKIKDTNFKFQLNNIIDLSKVIKNNSNSVYHLNGVVLYNSQNLEYIAYSYNSFHKKWYKYEKDNIIPIEFNIFDYEYDYKLFPVIFFMKK